MADLLTKDATNTVKSTTVPWASQIPYLESGFAAAKNLWQQPGPAYYSGDTVANFDPAQTTAQDMVINTATGGSPVMDAANNYAMDVLSGQYLNSDPYADPVFQNIQSKIMPAINSQYMMSGRTPSGEGGSQAYADTMTRGLTEAYAPWASQNYQFGQKQMSDMAQFAPDLRKMDYFDAGAMSKAGAERQAQSQAEIDALKARWDYNQQLPYNKLSDYMGLVGGTNWGNSSTTKTPTTKPTDAGEILGGITGILGGIGDIFGGSLF